MLRDLLMTAVGWKKPSANLPFLETSLSPNASAWPAVRVSVAEAAEADHGEVSREVKRRRVSNICRGFMDKQDWKYDQVTMDGWMDA